MANAASSAAHKINEAAKLVESVRVDIAQLFSSGKPDGILELRDALSGLVATLTADLEKKRSIVGTFDLFAGLANDGTFGPDVSEVLPVISPRKRRTKAEIEADKAKGSAKSDDDEADEADDEEDETSEESAE